MLACTCLRAGAIGTAKQQEMKVNYFYFLKGKTSRGDDMIEHANFNLLFVVLREAYSVVERIGTANIVLENIIQLLLQENNRDVEELKGAME